MALTHRQAVLLISEMRRVLESATLAAHADGLTTEQSVAMILATSHLRDAYNLLARDILREHPLLIGDVECAGLQVIQGDRRRAESMRAAQAKRVAENFGKEAV